MIRGSLEHKARELYDDIIYRQRAGHALDSFHRLQVPDTRHYDVVGPKVSPPLLSDHAYARLMLMALTGIEAPRDRKPNATEFDSGKGPVLICYLKWLVKYGELLNLED